MAKAKSMIISKKPKHTALKHKSDKLRLSICNNPLEVVQSTKYVGFYIDNALDWKKHIQDKTKNYQDDLGC